MSESSVRRFSCILFTVLGLPAAEGVQLQTNARAEDSLHAAATIDCKHCADRTAAFP